MENERGNKLRRNRRHLIKSEEAFIDFGERETADVESTNGEELNIPLQEIDDQIEAPSDNVVLTNESQSGSSHERTTRSGRVSRKPARYNDYVCK